MTDYGDGSGHGFIDYIDETGHGLANQGWKDSGDSIQWRDGSLAQGPIALCEVQGYAYEAAVRGADLLDALGEEGGGGAAGLGGGPARPLPLGVLGRDARGPLSRRSRSTPSSARSTPSRATSATSSAPASSIPTRSPRSPRSCSAIDVVGLRHPHDVDRRRRLLAAQLPRRQRVGARHRDRGARDVARRPATRRRCGSSEGLLAAAEGFGFRMPELYSGDPATQTRVPTPYPAACRPQAWSAAAAIACAEAVRAAAISRPSTPGRR